MARRGAALPYAGMEFDNAFAIDAQFAAAVQGALLINRHTHSAPQVKDQSACMLTVFALIRVHKN
jgi:hypothetical protein